MVRRLIPLVVIVALFWSLIPTSASAHQLSVLGHSLKGHTSNDSPFPPAHPHPPTAAECQADKHTHCYSPQELRKAYGLTSVLDSGITGKGETIAIINSFGSPTALDDLKKFDKDYGLPDPPSFEQIAPIGSVPFDRTNIPQIQAAMETSMDVQWSHAMAPDADIVVLTSPVDQFNGVTGLPEFLQLDEYAINHHYRIISQSWAASEHSLFTPEGKKVLNDFNNFYKQAVEEEDATFFSASGDNGSVGGDENGKPYSFPDVSFPASSPWATAVGGTTLSTDADGNYQSEKVWKHGSTTSTVLPASASGGGISQYFDIPDYQKANLPQSVLETLKGHRGVPDVSAVADSDTGVPIYMGFLDGVQDLSGNGYYNMGGGTSLSTPLWAGFLADASQYAGHPISHLNNKLYQLGQDKETYARVFHDITVGDNVAWSSVPGYEATEGWDLTTGWGTPIADKLFAYLASGDN
jgi:subtilase family serine protease